MSLVIENKADYDLLVPPGQCQGKSVYLKDLENSTIKIYDSSSSAHLENLKNCIIHIGPISSLCVIQNCSSSSFSIACSSLQVHSSIKLTLFVFCETEPKISASSDLKFAPYNIGYSGQEQCFSKAKLNPYKDKWSEICDCDRNEIETHYELLPPRLFTEENFTFPDLGESVNPVPRHIHYGGNLRYEIIPYSKQQKFITQRRELPPSNTVVHKEGDMRKYIPFTGPVSRVEPALPQHEKVVKFQRVALRYNYNYGENFKYHIVPEVNKDMVDGTLKEFRKILDMYYEKKKELEISWFFSVVACLLLVLQLQVLRMASEWINFAWAGVLTLLVLSEIIILVLCSVKWVLTKKCFFYIVKEFIEKKSEKFKKNNVEMTGTLEFLEIYINNAIL